MAPAIFRLISQNEVTKVQKLPQDQIQSCLDKDGYTPLTKCCELYKIDMVKALLLLKMNPNELDQNGKGPMHYAAKEGFEDLVKLLLNKGADLNLQDKEGKTALHHACEYKCLPLIKYLLDFNPVVDVRDRKGKTPLDLARANGCSQVVNLLEKLTNGDSSDSYEECGAVASGIMVTQLMNTIKDLQKQLEDQENRFTKLLQEQGKRLTIQEKASQSLETATSKIYNELWRNRDNPLPAKPSSLPPKMAEKPDVKPRECVSDGKGSVDYENIGRVHRYGGLYHDAVVLPELSQAESATIQSNYKAFVQSFEFEKVKADLYSEKFVTLDLMKQWRKREVSCEDVIEHIIFEEVLGQPRQRLQILKDILSIDGQLEAVQLLTPKVD